MHKTDPEQMKTERGQVVLFSAVQHHQALVKINRILLLAVSVLMTVILIIGFWIMPDYGITQPLRAQKNNGVSIQQLQNPALSQEINALKGQLVGLVSGSIESKLRTLEQSVRSGSLGVSLGAIEDIKNDIRVLRSYSQVQPAQAKAGEKGVRKIDAQLIEEMAQLKRLIYLTLGSCGLLIAAIAGFWIRQRLRIETQQVNRYLHKR